MHALARGAARLGPGGGVLVWGTSLYFNSCRAPSLWARTADPRFFRWAGDHPGHTAALLEAIPPNAWFQTFVPEQSKCD